MVGTTFSYLTYRNKKQKVLTWIPLSNLEVEKKDQEKKSQCTSNSGPRGQHCLRPGGVGHASSELFAKSALLLPTQLFASWSNCLWKQVEEARPIEQVRKADFRPAGYLKL